MLKFRSMNDSIPASPAEIPVIDVEKVFASKSPKIARLIPGFVFRYLKKIVHQDDINEFLSRHGRKKNIDFINAAIKDFNVKIHVEGKENFPREGKYIFVANHTLGGFDGMVLMQIMSEYYKDFRSLSNDILMNVYPMKELFIPINKHGKQAMEAVRLLDEAYNSDVQILTFPAGLVSRRIKGQIIDLPWQKSFIVQAVKYQRNIVPIHFNGRNTNFFYNLANLRKFLGIKTNIEMLFLVDETFKHKNKELTVKIGKPIDYRTFDKSRKPAEWAKWVKEQVYALDGVTHVPF
jgi:putative hemolysin